MAARTAACIRSIASDGRKVDSRCDLLDCSVMYEGSESSTDPLRGIGAQLQPVDEPARLPGAFGGVAGRPVETQGGVRGDVRGGRSSSRERADGAVARDRETDPRVRFVLCE